MEINILSGSNAPETTNVLMGIYNGEGFNIDVTGLAIEDKINFDNFIALIGNESLTSIINTPYELSANMVVPTLITIGNTSLDYDAMSNEDKQKIDNFALLF